MSHLTMVGDRIGQNWQLATHKENAATLQICCCHSSFGNVVNALIEGMSG